MDEFDENGWAHIHHAAYNGYHKSVARFVKGREDQLELVTGDGKQSTPLLLSCTSGNIDTVQVLIELGADLKATDRQMHGPVELAAMNNHITLLEFFLELNCPELKVWKCLVDSLSGNGGQDLETATAKTLVELTVSGRYEHVEEFLKAGGIPALVNLLKGNIASEDAKAHALSVLLNLFWNENARQELGAKGIASVVSQARAPHRPLYVQATKLLALLADEIGNKEKITSVGGVEALAKLLQQFDDEELVENCLTAVREIANSTTEIQTAIGSNKDIMKSIGQLLAGAKNKRVLAMAARTVGAIVYRHKANQDSFVSEGGVQPLVELTRLRSRECQFAAVEAIHALAEENEGNQGILTEHGCVMILMRLLKRSRAADLRTLTAGGLWAIAGNKNSQRRSVANEVGVNLLIEFLSENLPESLHFIGSEALGVLAEGVHNKRNEIASANGVMPLVQLVGKASTPAYIILSALRTLRALCLCVGFRPHTQIQDSVAQNHAIKFLIRFLFHARQEVLKVEAAYTLGCVALGHHGNMKAILDHKDFSFIHILRLLYDEEEAVQLLAGAALATFAYNNVANQRNIAMSGGVRYHCFTPFLESKDEQQVVHAAFQVVVLSRIIPDEDQALSSATGIKLLVKMLASQSEDVQALTANFLGALAHTRAGIPAAIISIGTIPVLSRMLISPYETVQASAAIALAYLSHNGVGQRQILNVCRHDPFLFKVLQFHIGKVKLSEEFVERWHHCKHIGLPPIT